MQNPIGPSPQPTILPKEWYAKQVVVTGNKLASRDWSGVLLSTHPLAVLIDIWPDGPTFVPWSVVEQIRLSKDRNNG